MNADGHTLLQGADASIENGDISRIRVSDSVNRMYRTRRSKTRPPFRSRVVSGNSDAIEILEKGNIYSTLGYEAVKSTRLPHVVAQVRYGNKGYILAGRVAGNEIVDLRVIFSQLNPAVRHGFFVQAYTDVFFQNGLDYPVYWDGLSDAAESIKPGFIGADNKNQIEYLMPIGNVMCYAHGRIFVGDENNLVYASNHIYGSGFFNNARNLANFSEQTYPSSGGAFTAPAGFGQLTGITYVPRQPSANGHGEVVVMHENGSYTIDPTIVRNQWTDRLDIQKIATVGRGCSSPYSIVQLNNDIWFRGTDRSMSSIRNIVSDQNTRWGTKSWSRPVQKYLDFDAATMLRFSRAMRVNNRMVCSCAIIDDYPNIYALGLVVMDLDIGSDAEPEIEFEWDGVWTGLRVTSMCSLSADAQNRYFFFSADEDGKNRIYELLDKSTGNDEVDGKEVKIESYYVVSQLFSQLNPQDIPVFKTLSGIILRGETNGEATIDISIRESGYNCWTGIDSQSIGADRVIRDTDEGGIITGTEPFPTSVNSASVPHKFQQATQERVDIGESFDVRVDIKGDVTIHRLTALTEFQKEDILTTNRTCSPDWEEGIWCGGENIFNYKIVNAND